MEIKIMTLKTIIENSLAQSQLPAEIKRLILVEQVGIQANKASMALREQIKEAQKADAEGVLQNHMDELSE